MADIFLSYARDDAEKATQLAETLEASGWTVFLDLKLRGGQEWREAIFRELNAARCVVVLWSEFSVDRRWVIQEAEEAYKTKKLVAAHIGQVEPPFGFKHIHSSDLTEWEPGRPSWEFDRLVEGIAVLAGSKYSISGMDPETAKFVYQMSGDVRRFSSEGHFAAYCGVVPGHRAPFNGQLRNVLIEIAREQRGGGGPGQTYFERKLHEGRSEEEALLALARQVSRAVYRHLMHVGRRD